MKYIKKTVAIEAVQFKDASLETVDKIAEFMQGKQSVLHTSGEPKIEIPTLEGVMTASLGDFIIKGVNGEFYPCKPDIFEKTYISEDQIGTLSDGYHTFDELYNFRKMYNAAAFNAWTKDGLYNVHKSKRHNDGMECFGGGWFIVMAVLPTGQVSNHYKMEDWDLFQCPEEEIVKFPYDGHTAQDVLNRLENVARG
jgi:hypothetical protein